MNELGLKIENLHPVLESMIITHPVGMAAQDAAIAAIWALGVKHEILRPVAIQALTSLSGFKAKITNPYLADLKSKYSEKLLATADYEQQLP